MKNLKILLCLISLIEIKAAFSQCYNTIKTTSTDWRNFQGTNAFPNDFNWTLPGNTYPIYLSDNLNTPSAIIELPYFCSQAPGTGSCEGFHNVVQYQFNGPLPSDQDIHPEDGWELLLKNFGTPNPVGQSTGGKRVGNPYFILYNRHTGKMKVFMALMGIQSKQAAFIRIGFDNSDPGTKKLSNTNQATIALFNGAEAIQKTVEEFKPVLEFKQMNQVMGYQNTTDYQWTVGELNKILLKKIEELTLHLIQMQKEIETLKNNK